ncbi:all-trans-retinol 13,14-reductase-like [Daphnia pulicaria]|uniref:all-trans-retinol 13,14-reductase-like n=1 Tax=Daphnia pulicaria TaxID=35523 RepID=UPI001EEB381E|nr:all-trans-retinol 13,14-reductase-like [Daphnia pulicaria]
MMKRANRPFGYSLGCFAFKILPLWLVKVMCFFGLPCLLSDYFVLNKRSIQEVVKGLTKNSDLQFLLAYSSGGFGVNANRASISMLSMLHLHCCEYGSCYPVGGASEIPYRIIPVIERSGGRVLMKAHVSQILTENGRVMGVRVGQKEQSAVDLYAPIVISDAGLQNTFQDLLPENVAKFSPSWSLANSLPAALGNLTVFIGLKGTPEDLGLTAQNVWIFTNHHPIDEFEMPESEETLRYFCENPYPAIFISSASAKDPSWAKRYPDRSTISVMSFIPYSFFAKWSHLKVKKRGDDYNALKNAYGLQILDQVIREYPKMKNAIDYFSVATPVTIEHYLSTKKGGTYGLEHDMERFDPEQSSLLRPESGIEGLFFSGQDVTTCGFASTMLSGLLCAGAVLRKKYSIALDLLLLHTKLSGRPENLDSLFF